MPQRFDPTLLHGDWVHVSDEDTPDTMVLRPAQVARAPSRGGAFGLHLAPGAVVQVRSVGRGDAPDVAGGTWRLAGPDENELELRLDTGETIRRRIIGVERGRLLLKKD